MKVLMLGDVNGSPGRRILKERLKKLRESLNLSAVIVNGENAAAGNGITIALAKELIDCGADVITLGDHTWGQKELVGTIGSFDRMVRPANGGYNQPGRGWTIVNTQVFSFAVVNLLGRVFMGQADCPFRTMDVILQEIPKNIPVFVDFHAEATSEKVTLAHYLDGRVVAIAGTHTHVQTSDAMVLPKGTAFITDLGMCGPYISSIGRDLSAVTKKFISGMPARFEIAEGPAVLEGAVIDFDNKTLKATGIEAIRIREPLYMEGNN